MCIFGVFVSLKKEGKTSKHHRAALCMTTVRFIWPWHMLCYTRRHWSLFVHSRETVTLKSNRWNSSWHFIAFFSFLPFLFRQNQWEEQRIYMFVFDYHPHTLISFSSIHLAYTTCLTCGRYEHTYIHEIFMQTKVDPCQTKYVYTYNIYVFRMEFDSTRISYFLC